MKVISLFFFGIHLARQEKSIPHLTLTVLSGPDAGMTLSFRKQKISLGRDQTNDFVLSDGFVSNRHGEILYNQDKLIYVDLRSRHGSLVIVNNVSTHLHHPNSAHKVSLSKVSEIQIGTSVVRISAPQNAPETFDSLDEEFGNFKKTESEGSREHLITVAQQPITKLSEHLSTKDKSLEVIFNLVKDLNGKNTLTEVIERINDAAFRAFSSANFFSITLGETPNQVEINRPFLTVDRDGKGDIEPILSRSILRQAADTEESILWVKDSFGTMEVSKSIVDAKIDSCLCSPLIGQSGLLGVMQVDTRGRGAIFGRRDLDLFNVLASSAAFAVERAKLSNDIVKMFEGFVEASVTAIEARDPTTAGHSHRVASYTVALAEETNKSSDPIYGDFSLTPSELTELRYAALLHDFGKIGVHENVLNKSTRLSEINLELVAERFKVIKTQEYNHALNAFITAIETNQKAPHLEQIRMNHARFSAYLDEKLEWLESINTSGFLADADVASIREFASHSYIDLHGDQQYYLTDSEVNNLTIKRGNLNEEEWENMRSHAARSKEYLQQIPWSPALKNIPCIAGDHHEKMDGTGYPTGIDGEAVITQVRMLTISDIFDALTAVDRPYRKAASLERAAKILTEDAQAKKLDPVLVSIFVNTVVPKIMHLIPSLNKTQ